MKRDVRRKLVFLECLFNAAKGLGGQHSHLLLSEALHGIYAYQNKHRNCGYYDFDDPSTTEAELLAMLKKPLGAIILGDNYRSMERMFSDLKRLQREEERDNNLRVFPPITPTSTGKRGFVYWHENGRLTLMRLGLRLEMSECFINGIDEAYSELDPLAAEVVDVEEDSATGKLYVTGITEIGSVTTGQPIREVLRKMATEHPQVLAAVLNDHTILSKALE